MAVGEARSELGMIATANGLRNCLKAPSGIATPIAQWLMIARWVVGM